MTCCMCIRSRYFGVFACRYDMCMDCIKDMINEININANVGVIC